MDPGESPGAPVPRSRRATLAVGAIPGGAWGADVRHGGARMCGRGPATSGRTGVRARRLACGRSGAKSGCAGVRVRRREVRGGGVRRHAGGVPAAAWRRAGMGRGRCGCGTWTCMVRRGGRAGMAAEEWGRGRRSGAGMRRAGCGGGGMRRACGRNPPRAGRVAESAELVAAVSGLWPWRMASDAGTMVARESAVGERAGPDAHRKTAKTGVDEFRQRSGRLQAIDGSEAGPNLDRRLRAASRSRASGPASGTAPRS